MLLRALGIGAWVMGGWAEELLGLRPAGLHRDVDLLVERSAAEVDAVLRGAPGIDEIRGKRFHHKRAFQLERTMVELILVRHDDRGRFTLVHGSSRHNWPADVLDDRSRGLRVASRAAVVSWRVAHAARRAAARAAR